MNQPGRGSSQSRRAVAAREWRGYSREKRRFNTLLNGYINVKYGGIYNEYSQFFNSLNQSHSEARDLTKTKTYKKWKKEQQSKQGSSDLPVEPVEKQESSDLPVEPVEAVEKQESSDLPVEPVEAVEKQESSDLPVEPVEVVEDLPHDRPEPFEDSLNLPAQPDILSAAVDEILSANIVNVNDVDNIIDEIINDLQQDDVIQNILMNDDELVRPHYEDEDEGIGLNLETELEYVIEPFDYESEVEGFDF